MQDPATFPAPTASARLAPLGTSSRTWAGVLAALFFTVLAIAAWLDPSPTGHGTHRQLGMPECSWVVWFGKPCMTCGMTTAFSHAAHLNFRASIRAQPAGFLASLLTGAAFWCCLYVALTGSRVGVAAINLLGRKTLIVTIATLLGAWAYKLATWTS